MERPATDTMRNDALNVTADADDLALVKASQFTAPAGTLETATVILTFQHEVADDEGTMDVDESRDAAEIMGTYEGAMGTFKCNADTACTVTVNTKGAVSAVSSADDWIFIPADGATVAVADTDYLHYGFWLQKETDADGAVTYDEVQTFAGARVGDDTDGSGNVSNVTGSATYAREDGAVGVYVRETYDPNDRGEVVTATSGHFTADVSLTATFGQVNDDEGTGTIAPNLVNTLTGDITNFDLSGGEANEWAVNLAKGAITTGTGIASGVANGGGDPGSWNATFHGDVTAVDHDDDPTTDNVAPHPSSVVGEFNANFGNGTTAGAFGARKE